MSRNRWTAEQLQDRISKSKTRIANAASEHPKTKRPNVTRKTAAGITEYLQQLQLAGFPQPTFEYKFCPDRKWRSDFAWLDKNVLAEYEGGTFTGGAHTRGEHYARDCEKYSVASIMGFVLIRFTFRMVRNGQALELTRRALKL